MTLQQQPSRTSCGPTCVAMLAGVPVSEVLARLRSVRKPARQHKRTHSTNTGELARLLAVYGFSLGRRIRSEAAPESGRFILRIGRVSGRGRWHWAVLADGEVLDPGRFDVGVVGDYDRVSFYEVEGVEQ